MPTQDESDWSLLITPRGKLLTLNLRQTWRQRDLVRMFVRRDIVQQYKQTILGPLWFLIQPLLTTGLFILVFNRVAKLPTDGVPPILFYMSGTVFWAYFAESLTSISGTFISNSKMFEKVYFPRVIVPISAVISGLLKLLIQMGLFLGFYTYLYSDGKVGILPNYYLLLLPALILTMALLSMGMGMIIASVTIKYRDLRYALPLLVQLMMMASPVIYPASLISEDRRWILSINPMTGVLETARHAFFGSGHMDWPALIYSFAFATVIFIFGLLTLNRTERRFLDVI